MSRIHLVISASLLALVSSPAAAQTTMLWSPQTVDTGWPSDFDDATQTFAGVFGDTITFNGPGYFHNHGGPAGFTIDANVNGSWTNIYTYAAGTPTNYLLLSSLGSLSFAGGSITGLRVDSTSYVGQAFHGFSGETFTISSAVPEPATWAMLLLGFGLLGGTMRARRGKLTVTYA